VDNLPLLCRIVAIDHANSTARATRDMFLCNDPNEPSSKDIVPGDYKIVLLQPPKSWGKHAPTVFCSIDLALCHNIVACSTQEELCSFQVDDRRCLCDLACTVNEPCKGFDFVSVFRDDCGIPLLPGSERGVPGKENYFNRIVVEYKTQDGSSSEIFASPNTETSLDPIGV
jgi:hypothetical protein